MITPDVQSAVDMATTIGLASGFVFGWIGRGALTSLSYALYDLYDLYEARREYSDDHREKVA